MRWKWRTYQNGQSYTATQPTHHPTPTEGNSVETATLVRQPIELHVEVNPNGEVTPVVPVSWTITEELVQTIADLHYTNPHVLLIVASRRTETYGKKTTYSYDATKTYAIDLMATPKAYVQFSRPGDNVIIAAVVDLVGKYKLREVDSWIKGRQRPYFTVDEKKQDLDYLEEFSDPIASFIQKVAVPKELFAPPPPKFLKSLVTQFFPAYAVDQCHFRKRVIFSSLLSIPVQLYGVFARLLTLLYGLFMLERGMNAKTFFALNPHDFAHSFEGSFWFVDKDLRERDSFWKFLSPPALVIYAAILLIAGFVLSIIPMFYLGIKYEGNIDANFTWGEFLLAALIGDGGLALLIGFIWLVGSRDGRRFASDVEWWFRDRFASKNSGDSARQEAAKLSAEQQLIAQLTQRAQAGSTITKAEDVKDNSIKLLFYNVKMKVCKPFAT